MITITLTEAELAALQSEQMPKETLESVIHRLIAPLVNRLATDSFKAFLATYQDLPLEAKVDVITAIKKIPVLQTQPVDDFVVVEEPK